MKRELDEFEIVEDEATKIMLKLTKPEEKILMKYISLRVSQNERGYQQVLSREQEINRMSDKHIRELEDKLEKAKVRIKALQIATDIIDAQEGKK